MAVIAYDFYTDRRARPRGPETVAKKGLFGLGAPKPPQRSGGPDAFGFLYRTPGWSAESICLGYVLTETTISSVIVRATDPDHLRILAETPERDLPPSLAAQIEMGRVAASAAA